METHFFWWVGQSLVNFKETPHYFNLNLPVFALCGQLPHLPTEISKVGREKIPGFLQNGGTKIGTKWRIINRTIWRNGKLQKYARIVNCKMAKKCYLLMTLLQQGLNVNLKWRTA